MIVLHRAWVFGFTRLAAFLWLCCKDDRRRWEDGDLPMFFGRLMGNIRYQRTAHRITSAVNCRPLKPSPRSICPAAPYPTGVHIPGIPPPAKFATEPHQVREPRAAASPAFEPRVTFAQLRQGPLEYIPPRRAARHVAPLLAGQMSADYIRSCRQLTSRRTSSPRQKRPSGAIETDRFPPAPRLDPLRSALAKLEPSAAPKPTPLPKPAPPAKADKRGRR
jgi:hypothetical protein